MRLGRFLGPKFGDLGVHGDLGAQIEVPEGPLGTSGAHLAASWSHPGGHLGPTSRPETMLQQGSQHGCISLSRLIRATRVTQLDKSSNERIKESIR